jgi:hypothetical protein
MFAGHVGAALLLGKAEPRVSLATFVFAALLLDVVLWASILLGWESVTIPENFATTHQPAFVFPYSHGLATSIAWSVLAAAAVFLVALRGQAGRARACSLVGLAVFSHWLLDALVHAPELPLSGVSSTKLGLGLWNQLPLALGVEALLVVAGLALFLAGSPLSRARRLGLGAFVLLILAFTITGMTLAPPPPSAAAMASSSLLTIALTCALMAWLGKQPARVNAPQLRRVAKGN